MLVFYDWPFPHVYFAKNVAGICLFLFLAQFSATVSSFMGILYSANYGWAPAVRGWMAVNSCTLTWRTVIASVVVDRCFADWCMGRRRPGPLYRLAGRLCCACSRLLCWTEVGGHREHRPTLYTLHAWDSKISAVMSVCLPRFLLTIF